MKKYFSLLALAFLFISCEEDVVLNSPSVQGRLENTFWRAIDSDAVLQPNGGLVITAKARLQTMTLRIPSRNVGTYVLGENQSRVATFVFNYDGSELFYSTGVTTEEDFQGDGEIKITEFDAANGTVSGSFRFNAVNMANNPLGGEILNFNQGVFYKVPVTGIEED